MPEPIECFWHGPEVDQPDDFWSCGECLHIWRTQADFDRDVAYRSEQEPDLPELNPRRQWHCPLCAHDF